LRSGELKPFRHHTDYDVAFTVEHQCFAENILPASEAPLPHSVAYYGHVIISRLIFFGAEDAPEHGLYA
jgi:hypothetical protein